MILYFDEILNHELISDGFNAFTIGLGCSCLEISRNVRKGERISTWRQLAKGSRFQHLRLGGPFCSAILMLGASLQDKRHIKGKRGRDEATRIRGRYLASPSSFSSRACGTTLAPSVSVLDLTVAPKISALSIALGPTTRMLVILIPLWLSSHKTAAKRIPFLDSAWSCRGHGGNQKTPAQC